MPLVGQGEAAGVSEHMGTGALANALDKQTTPIGDQDERCNVNGGRTRTRTLDPLIKSQLLYQLSYAP
jgi:hypothetical protein